MSNVVIVAVVMFVAVGVQLATVFYFLPRMTSRRVLEDLGFEEEEIKPDFNQHEEDQTPKVPPRSQQESSDLGPAPTRRVEVARTQRKPIIRGRMRGTRQTR